MSLTSIILLHSFASLSASLFPKIFVWALTLYRWVVVVRFLSILTIDASIVLFGWLFCCVGCVMCSAIESISCRYHYCGPIVMLEDMGSYRGSSLRMAFRIFRCHRALKTNEGLLDTSFGDLKPT
jgi:hypothetical protein